MGNISHEEFTKLDIRVGKIIRAEPVQGSTKLLKLDVDLGEEVRQVIAGIAKNYEPNELVGKEFVVLANLETRKLMGLESEGMLLCADVDGEPVCLTPLKEVPPGSKVR